MFVIGSGPGGLAGHAWEAAKSGCASFPCLTHTRLEPSGQQTYRAQGGGIIYARKGDESPEQLVATSLAAGAGISSPRRTVPVAAPSRGARLVERI